MNKPFIKELIVTNYLLIGAFALIIVAGNLLYGGTVETWLQTMIIAAILALALVFKMWRIKASSHKLDERLQLITYRAVTIGFYFMLAAIFWFYTKELIVEGQVSTRTIVELVAGMTGYIGSLLVLSRHY